MDEFFNQEVVDLGDPPKSYKAMLVGEENREDYLEDEDLLTEKEMDSDVFETNFNGFDVVEELDESDLVQLSSFWRKKNDICASLGIRCS